MVGDLCTHLLFVSNWSGGVGSEWDLNSELDSMSESESDSASDDKLN